MVYLGGFCLILSMVGLYILLFSSFSPKQKQQITGDFIKKAARKIRIPRDSRIVQEIKKNIPNPQVSLLIQSILIGEVVGLFFLFLDPSPLKFKVLAINAAFLLTASFLCSILTLLNAWWKKKTHLVFRVILQVTTLVIGLILFRMAIKERVANVAIGGISVIKAGYCMKMAIYGYFITVVIAISTMLYTAIKGNPENTHEFEFSNYLFLVVMSGLLIGSGLFLAYSIKFVGF